MANRDEYVTYKALAEVELELTRWLVDRLEGKADRADLDRFEAQLSELRENAVRRTGPMVDDLNRLFVRVEQLEQTRNRWIGEHMAARAVLAAAIAIAGLAISLIIHYV